MTQEVKVPADELKRLVADKLAAAGLNRDHADKTADVIVHADIRGVFSHGVMRVEHYAKRLKIGSLSSAPNMTLRKVRSGSAVLDADHAMGHVATMEAMDHAIEMARESGIAMVAVENSSHCGALSYFVARAAKQGMIGLAMAPCDKLVAPFGGSKPFFGANPLAIGFPCKRNDDLIIDMATSNVAFGKILHAREKDTEIPGHWGLDEEGTPTTDPHQVRSLTPFGGYKGYALMLAIDVLGAVLLGANYGPHIAAMYENYDKKRCLSGTMIAIDPSTFIGLDHFTAQMDAMIDELHAAPPGPGMDQVLVPGDPELVNEQNSLRDGVTVVSSIYNFLKGDD